MKTIYTVAVPGLIDEDFNDKAAAEKYAKESGGILQEIKTDDNGNPIDTPGPLQVPELTPQDKGEPSPVPYTLMLQKPSPDCPQEGVEKVFFRGAYKELWQVTAAMTTMYQSETISKFIKEAFEKHGAYRMEIIVADWSIKVYKHPNNP